MYWLFLYCFIIISSGLQAPPDFISLDNLKAEFGLSGRSDVITDKEILEGKNIKLVLLHNSKRFLLNGRVYKFSRPVKIKDGKVFIPYTVCFYLKKYIKPETKKKAPERIKICIDPGHGGKFSGAVADTLVEKDINLDVALILKKLLEGEGYEVVMTRKDDTQLSQNHGQDLIKRVNICHSAKADIFVSIHTNSSKDPSIYGCEIYIPRDTDTRSKRRCLSLAKCIQSQIKKAGINFRGIKQANFVVLKKTRCPAVLVEIDYLSNPQAKKMLARKTYRRKFANLLKNAIKDYHFAYCR